MRDHKYRRTLEELRERASMFWPSEVLGKEAQTSVIPELLKTQDQFISMLGVPMSDLDGFVDLVRDSEFSAQLFIKHLLVLSDFSGENLIALNSEFENLFPNGRLCYRWRDKNYTYEFKALPIPGKLNNSKLRISGKKLFEERPLDELKEDVIAILLVGAASTDKRTASFLDKCEIVNYLGQPEDLEKFVKQRYIWVSRQTQGAQANTLGQIAQNTVKEYLEEHLNVDGVEINRDGNLPGVSHTDPESKQSTTFDLVISKGDKRVALEVGFQETGNSTVERKSGQAQSRFEQVNKAGYKLGYVIDGAGNFGRENVIRTLCRYSHVTIAFSPSEFEVLCDFVREYFEDGDP